MSFKTQVRLEQITGSLPNDSLSPLAAGSINAADLGVTLDHLTSAIKRLHGASTFSEQAEGVFNVDMQVTGTLGVTQLATLNNGLIVNTAAADFNAGVTANEIKIDGDVIGNLYIVGSSGEIFDSNDLAYDGSTLTVNGDVSAIDGSFSGDLSAVDGSFTGDLSAVGGSFSGDLSAVDGSFSGDLSAVDGSFSGDLTAVGGSFTGDVDVDGDLTIGSVAIDGDTPTRLYIVDADGTLKDEAKLTFDGSDLSVDGNIVISGDLTVQGTTTTLETQNLLVEDNVVLIGRGLNTSANANGGLAIASGSSGGDALVFGRVANDTFGVGSKDVEDGTVGSLADMTLVNFRAAKFELDGSSLAIQAPAADHMQMDALNISFITADSDEMTAGYLKLANDGEVATFKAAFGDDASIISAINQAANASSSKLMKIIDSPVATGVAVAVTGLAHDGGAGGPKMLDVFVNGQLMTSGSSAENNPAGDDYYIHPGVSAAPFDVTPTSSQLVFTFSLQPKDVITVFDKA